MRKRMIMRFFVFTLIASLFLQTTMLHNNLIINVANADELSNTITDEITNNLNNETGNEIKNEHNEFHGESANSPQQTFMQGESDNSEELLNKQGVSCETEKALDKKAEPDNPDESQGLQKKPDTKDEPLKKDNDPDISDELIHNQNCSNVQNQLINTQTDEFEETTPYTVSNQESICHPDSLSYDSDIQTDQSLLTWEPVIDAAGYLIFRNGEEIADVTITTFTDTNLESGAIYEYAVKAYNSDNESLPSEPVYISIGYED